MKVSIQIIALFSVAILMSFIPECFRDFFGDWKCAGSGGYIIGAYKYQNCNSGLNGMHEATWHWGYRHYLFFLMGLTLFITQVGYIINDQQKTK